MKTFPSSDPYMGRSERSCVPSFFTANLAAGTKIPMPRSGPNTGEADRFPDTPASERRPDAPLT
jgi:hypothetical protein